ncbi:serine hydrolase [Janthinobacterium sp. SUN026]|uniref:serine hydrolase domain-containing protein n=1 Tax=Janthinobacterium sp. SUN026 TaxID=3002438 RepID=UPI0025AFE136|nr:serine hydrolase [Janthinobacterium sp. SUN026]MDN2672800.1 serine hydrolase [Janthinobacterium sp. SUN026]
MKVAALIAGLCLAFPVWAQHNTSASHDDLMALLQQRMAQQQIPALQVAVIEHGKVVELAALGTANVENGVPATNDSVFSINSCTKAFTGVAVMQLVEAGKIKLGDPIGLYLDDLPPAWRALTIRQLMTHTSGLPNIIDEQENLLGGENEALSWSKVKALPFEFAPGERYRYNQTGYVLIGKIIEKLSGESFVQFVENHQFKPAGLKHTRFGDSSDVVAHSAGAYTYSRNEGGKWLTGTRLAIAYVTFPAYFRPAAGILSTAGDIAQWLQALQGGKLLKDKASLQAMWSPYVLNNGTTQGPNDLLNGSALGWPVTVRGAHRAAGPIGGMRSAFFVYPEDALSVVVLTNLQGVNPELFIDDIAGLYVPAMHPSTGFGLPPEVLPLRTALLQRGFEQAPQVWAEFQARDAQALPGEEALNVWGYKLSSQQQLPQALAILRLNASVHPASWNAYDSLAEILEQAGDRQGAIANYGKSLALNAGNSHASERLRALQAR